MAQRVLNVTLAITIDTDINEANNIVDSLSFKINGDVLSEVKDSKIVDYFEVY